MNRKEPSQNPLFHVVINNEGQYSLWPAGEKIPPGWQKTAFAGNKEECLSIIKREWADMAPRSLRGLPSDPSDRTYQDNQQDGLAHHFFVEQAAKTPDAIAVVFKDQQITYKDLHHYSNQIGNYLQEIGVTPEKAVGLCVGRSIEMIAGFLGILKSGGVYVPLDPLYPAERLKTMIHESHLTALLVQEEFLADLAVTTACICSIDRDRELIAKKSIENVESPITPQNLSHIIFTSGSTGTPKGVMMPHATLSANLTGFMDKVKIHPEDRYLHTASLAFTSSLRQILAPLSCGARIVIADQEQRTNPLALFTLINTEKVTIWDTVAPFWETCTKSLLQKSPATRNEFLENSLRLILSSGGELPRSLIQTWRELSAKKVRLLNMYGQTETVGNILIYDIPDQLDTTPAVIPLGPPIEKTQVYLLNDNNQAPLQGEIGQIHVGGDILARGYINQSRLTAGQFIPDPFSDIPGRRLFKTGDQGSLLPDNTICFKGRTDFQVSIRGFRIEPGEAEAALKLHPGITGAVVSVFENASGNKELIAYFETEPERPVPGVDEIRQFLAGKIPEYMIPSRYMRLDSLPRLPNGKINRHDLPQPLLNKNRPELSSTYIVPGNPAERAIAEIWQEILNLEKVGIKDNFFDLGGNSLLAAQVIDRLSRLFTLEFPISMLFERPTVQSFSQIILQKDSEPVQGQDSVNRGKMRKAMQKRRMKG